MLGGRSLSRSLLLKLLLLALMAAGVLVFASAALAQPSSDNGFATLTKTASPNPVTVGQQLTFTLTETADPAKSDVGFSVIDTLPAGVRFVSATSSQGTCAFDPVANTVTCGPFAVFTPPTGVPSTTFTASIVVVPRKPGTITNTARDNFDTYGLPDNVVSVDVTVLPLPQQPAPQQQPQKQHALPPPAAVAPEVTQAPSQTYVSGANTNNAGSVQTGGP